MIEHDFKKRIISKMEKLKSIVDDESATPYKREQAAAKYLQMEMKYFPKVVWDSSKKGTARRKDNKNEKNK